MPLLRLADGRTVGAAGALLPRLVDLTHEDRAARGLRRAGEAASPGGAVHFTVPELLAMERAVLLSAPRGGGRTVLAEALASADPALRARLLAPASRGPGAPVLPQEAGWPEAVRLAGPEGGDWPDRGLLVIDGPERAADPGARLAAAMAWLGDDPARRLLVLCDEAAALGLRLPPGLARHALMPLPAAERAGLAAALGVADPVAADWAWPGPWALALAAGRPVRPARAAEAGDPAPWLDDERRAAALAQLPPEAVAAAVAADPHGMAGPLGALAAREDAPAGLAAALLQVDAPVALLAAARLVAPGSAGAPPLAAALAARIGRGGEPPDLRRAMGEALARLGDPRDLEALEAVPAGLYPMGGGEHPNARPAHAVALDAFRIGRHPVTCGAWARFVAATGRPWASPAGRDPARASHPACDLTWHDARAFCAWVTPRWRAEGRIGANEIARLPTEREWEAAARGEGGRRWPWGDAWAPERCNGAEAGLNDTCAVGLFPEGASPAGCLDMAGQAWEWCGTLWGREMAAPTFRYPWAPDGREDPGAPEDVRRVLRGGAFTSGRDKADGIYRGSLEPAGSWRGNGFRVVVAPA